MKKNILITGGCGFIGSHLAEKLANLNYNVFIIDNLSTGRKEYKTYKKNISLIKGDISSINTYKKLSKYKFEYVFHLAALADIVPSIQNPHKYFKSNVAGDYF